MPDARHHCILFGIFVFSATLTTLFIIIHKSCSKEEIGTEGTSTGRACSGKRKSKNKLVTKVVQKNDLNFEELLLNCDSEQSGRMDFLPSFFCISMKIVLLIGYMLCDMAVMLLWAHAHGFEGKKAGLQDLAALPGFANMHYWKDLHGKTWWMPVDGCPLAIPQPYWLILSLGTLKAAIFYILFKSTNIGHHGKCSCSNKDWMIFFGLSTYQTCILVWSLCSTILRIWRLMDISIWHRYECLGLAVNETAWDTNALMLVVKLAVRNHKSQYLRKNWDHLDEHKELFMYGTALLSAAFWLLLNCGFLISHVVFGIILFLPTAAMTVIVVLVSLAIAVKYFEGRCPQRLSDLLGGEDAAEEAAREAEERLASQSRDRVDAIEQMARAQKGVQLEERYIEGARKYLIKEIKRDENKARDEIFQKYYDKKPLIAVAAILLLGVGIQMISTQMTYFYDGLPWWDCIRVSIEERQVFLYVKHFWDTVVSTMAAQPWFADLLNEAS